MKMLSALFLALYAIRGALCVFIDQPANTTAVTNQPFTLSCLAHDGNPLTHDILWRKDGFEQLPSSSSGRIQISFNNLESRYSISSVLYADEGDYVCEALDQANTVLFTSYPGTLMVQGVPAFDPLLESQTVVAGSTVTFECSAIGDPPPSIAWSHNNQGLSEGGKISFTDSQLTITNVQEENDGFYECSASNAFGSNITSAKLSVNTPLDISVSILEASPYNVKEGSEMTLHCLAQGDDVGELVAIQWKDSNFSIVTSGVSVTTTSSTLTFLSITQNDEDVYSCSASTSNGGLVTDSIQINVIEPPKVNLSKSSVAVYEGEMLGVNAAPVCEIIAGDVPLTLQWLAPDGTQEAEVNGVLTLPGILDGDDAGVYTCKGINNVGEDSKTFFLEVYTSPVITEAPQDIHTSFGQEVLFTCTASGNPTPVYNWTRVDGNDIQPQATKSSLGLHLFTVSSDDAGSYTCTAENMVGESSATAKLFVTYPPEVVSLYPSEKQYITIGDSFTLTCTVSAPPGSQLLWYVNDTKLSQTADERIVISESSSMTSLVVNAAKSTDSGLYNCNVSNGNAFDHRTVWVTVGVIPVITVAPANVNLTQLADGFLPCISDGTPPPALTWYKTEETGSQPALLPLVGPTHRIETQGLHLFNVGRDDSGWYQCRAENGLGTVSMTARVRVEGSPLVYAISPVVLVSGESYQMTCSAHYDYPQPVYTWSRADGIPLTPLRFSTTSLGQLVVNPASTFDQTLFVCTAVNQYGSSSFMQAITIHVRPTVQFSSSSVTGFLDGNLTLSCPASGQPLPTKQWYLPDGSLAAPSQMDTISGDLILVGLQASSEGVYTCNATNSAGSDAQGIQLVVRGSPPRDVVVNVVSATALAVLWAPPDPDLASQLNGYRVTYGIRDLIDDRQTEEVLTDEFFAATNLEEYTEYAFTVQGVYENVEGIGVNVQGTTAESVPSAAPTNVFLEPIVEGFIAYWQGLDRFDQNGEILGYDILYRPTTDSTEVQPFQLTTFLLSDAHENSDQFNYTISDLTGGISYDVLIGAYNSAGAGPRSELQEVVTELAFPLVIVLSVCIPVGAVIVLLVLVVLIFFCLRVYRRRNTKSGYSPKQGEIGYSQMDDKWDKPAVSGPVPEIPPQVDSSSTGKFVIYQTDGSAIPSHPKVITADDVAQRERGMGAKVVSYRRLQHHQQMETYAEPQDTLSREEARERLPSHLRQGDQTKNVLRGKLPTVSSKVYDQPHDSRVQVVQKRSPKSSNWKQQQPLPKRPLSSATSDSATFYDDVSDPPVDSSAATLEEPAVSQAVVHHSQGMNKVPSEQKQGEKSKKKKETQKSRKQEPAKQPKDHQPSQKQANKAKSLQNRPSVGNSIYDDEIDPYAVGYNVEQPFVIEPQHRIAEDDDLSLDSELFESEQRTTSPNELSASHNSINLLEEPEDIPSGMMGSDSDPLYSSVSKQHREKKRSKITKEKMKEEAKQRKLQEKRRKTEKKAQKQAEKEKLRAMKKMMKKQSKGIDIGVHLHELDLSTKEGQRLQHSMDSNMAGMF